MSQQVKVYRDLVFLGNASYNPNIEGNPMYTKVFFHDHFIADPSEKDWVERETNGGTIAQAAANGGTVTLTTATADNDCAELSHGLQWSGAKNCVMEARVKMDVITLIGVNVGWVSAAMNTDNVIAFQITSGAATLATGPTNDGAAFCFDTDGSVDVWYMVATKATTDGTPVSIATAPVADTYENFRVAIDTSGNVTYYRNGVAKGYQAAAITAATLLTPYVAIIGRNGAAKVVTVDRITCWQDE